MKWKGCWKSEQFVRESCRDINSQENYQEKVMIKKLCEKLEVNFRSEFVIEKSQKENLFFIVISARASKVGRTEPTKFGLKALDGAARGDFPSKLLKVEKSLLVESKERKKRKTENSIKPRENFFSPFRNRWKFFRALLCVCVCVCVGTIFALT